MKHPLSKLAIAAALLAGPAAASAKPADDGRETAIDFAAEGAILDWHAEDADSVYIMDRAGRWYLATVHGPCVRLDSAPNIAFEPSLSGRFDRFSRVVTPEVRCQVASVVRASRPAAKGGRKFR
jgi:hypothetical protein